MATTRRHHAPASSATLADMEKAACCMIQIIKDTPDLSHTKLTLAGDMALHRYLPDYGQQNAGDSIDLIVNSATSASLLRKKLVQHPMSPIVESPQHLYYQRQASPYASKTSPPSASAPSPAPAFEIRINPEMLCPFLPSAAKYAHEIGPGPGHLPYISLVDLIVFKMDACALRDSPQRKQQEVRDAAALLELAAEHSALSLTDDQARVVEESLPDVLRHSSPDKQSKAWWQARLSGKCDPDARKPAKDVLTGLIEGMSLDEAAKKSPVEADANAWPTANVGRTSSSSSKTSPASIGSSSSSAHFAVSNSPMAPMTTPAFPTPQSHPNPKILPTAGPMRPRKFSTQQNNSVTAHSRKKSLDPGRPRRHSQVLGSLPSQKFAHNQPLDDGPNASPGLALTARFESTPDEGKVVTNSYF